MARGGKREGAGRKPGALGKKTVMAFTKMLEQGGDVARMYTALDFFQSIYQDERNSLSARMAAAAQCLPYETPKPAPLKAEAGDTMDRALVAMRDAAEALDARLASLAERRRDNGAESDVIH